MFYESSRQVHDFRVFKTIRSFGYGICNHKIGIHEANQEQADLLESILSFNNKTKPRSDEDKNKKVTFLIVQKIFMSVEDYFLMLLKVDYFH